MRRDVGFLVCGLSLVQRDLEDGTIFSLFPVAKHLVAPHPYRLKLRGDVEKRPQVRKFVAWLREEAGEARLQLEAIAAQA